MSIKAAIFDLDGTITEPFFDFDAIRREMGLGKNDKPILEAMERMDEKQRRRCEEILHFHEQRAVNESVLNEGVRETLDELRSEGIHIGILTRNKRSNALAVAKKHNLRFDAIFDREDGPVKPDAFGVLSLCRQFGVKPEEAVVVGDYLFDVQCAKAAGATAVLIKNHPEVEEFAKSADFTIERFDQLLQIIKL